MTNDIIADYLTRIRNATERKSKQVLVPSTRMTASLCEILKTENYIDSFEKVDNDIVITLKYIDTKPAIMHLERVSKPGLRNYMSYKDIPRVLNGLGISILSTSRGVMTGKKAKLEKLGGEFICKIW
jgi:small subunit ribosomal protein S8